MTTTKIILGEDCAADPNKCFEFVRNGLFNSNRTFGKHENIFGTEYYNNYGYVKPNIQVRVYKSTADDTTTTLLLPPGTQVHLNTDSSQGRANQAFVGEIHMKCGSSINKTYSWFMGSFEYEKGTVVKPSTFEYAKCFEYPSFSIIDGYKPNQFSSDCNSGYIPAGKAGIHFRLKESDD